MPGFEPSIIIFETNKFDKFLKGNSFAYIDIIDAWGPMHPYVFDCCNVKIRTGVVHTSKEFTLGEYKVAIVFARTKNSFDDIRKALRMISTEISETNSELFELYKRAHKEGLFTELSDVPQLT